MIKKYLPGFLHGESYQIVFYKYISIIEPFKTQDMSQSPTTLHYLMREGAGAGIELK